MDDAPRGSAPDTRAFGHRTTTSPSGRSSGVPQTGHFFGIRNLLLLARSLRRDRGDDFGDDVAGAPDDDPVADPDVLALDLVDVVQALP